MVPELPGFYYDEERKKYFKIESNRTAPPNAAWSSANVKRRKVESKEAAEARRRLKLKEGLVKQSHVLAQPLTGGRLVREFGVVDYELPIRSWAGELRARGEISLSHSLERRTSPNIPCLYVDGSDYKSGLGVVYSTLDAETLYGSYIPIDSKGNINFRIDPQQRRELLAGLTREMILVPQMSSIKYHVASHKILLTSRAPSSSAGLAFFSPPLSKIDDSKPAWLLGECDHYQRLSLVEQERDQVVNTCTAAPSSSNLTCLIGTNHGIMRLFNNGDLHWMTPRPCRRQASSSLTFPKDVFSIDFSTNQPQVCYAGGRQNHIWKIDIRTSVKDWNWFRHRSSIAHVKALNEHQIFAAGLNNGMAVYDVRFMSKRRTRPVLLFPEYKNKEHLHIGLDVSTSMGVVAAAQDDGKVAIFSLKSGKKVKAAAVDRIQALGVVKALMFQTLPNESTPSLFAGVGPYIQKFSFGADEGEE